MQLQHNSQFSTILNIKNMETKQKKYMNPHLAGFLLGVVLLLSFFVTREGLGASGVMKRITINAVDLVAPSHADNSTFYSKYVKNDQNPLKNRFIFIGIGILVGALFLTKKRS